MRDEGMSLVETTIILMVLAILTAVFSPSIQDVVGDARQTKAKEDCEAIGTAIVRLLRDTGTNLLLTDGDGSGTKANKVNLLVGNGNTPVEAATVNGATTNTTNIQPTSVSWNDPLGDGVESIYGHLVANNPGYTSPTSSTRRSMAPGYRGGYLSGIVGPDPWGYRYAVNSVYLGTATDATTSGEGHRDNGWTFDTFCVSAGANGRIEVDFEDTTGSGTSFSGTANDDIVYVIQGFGG